MSSIISKQIVAYGLLDGAHWCPAHPQGFPGWSWAKVDETRSGHYHITVSVDAREAALDDLERSVTGLAILREDRDQAIVDARHHGATLREIAYRAGLTPAGVAKILTRVLDNPVN